MFDYDYYENEENDFFDDSCIDNDVREKIFEIESLLRKNVRAEVLNEMQELERENKDLRDQLNQLRDVEKNWDAKMRELDKAITNHRRGRQAVVLRVGCGESVRVRKTQGRNFGTLQGGGKTPHPYERR